MRNRRSVWTIATAPFSEAHFATFPPELARALHQGGDERARVLPALREGVGARGGARPDNSRWTRPGENCLSKPRRLGETVRRRSAC
jgi:hypothetical protein